MGIAIIKYMPAIPTIIAIACVGCEKHPAREFGDSSEFLGNEANVYVVMLHQADEDAGSTLVAKGRILLGSSIDDIGEFDGHWEMSLTETADVNELSLLQGRGVFRCQISENDITFDLHPNVVDNNVEIIVTRRRGDPLEGTWKIVTDAGVACQGKVHIIESK